MSSETRATTMILGGMPILSSGMLALTLTELFAAVISVMSGGYVLDGLAIVMLITGVSIMK